jgi:putative transposase
MGQSLARILVHIVFSTHGRQPLLHEPLRTELHAYLHGILSECGCEPLQIGGVEDHVHLLFALGRTVSTSHLVEALKTGSSKWLKQRAPDLGHFKWQAGYGAFSVGQRDLPALVSYIRGQDEHHRTRRYSDEVRALLRRSGVSYDERYLWE